MRASRLYCTPIQPARGPTDDQFESYCKRTDWVLPSGSRLVDRRREGWLLTRLRECRHHDCQQGAVRSATDKICDRRRLRSITDRNRMRFGSERAAQSAQSGGHPPAFRGHRAIFGGTVRFSASVLKVYWVKFAIGGSRLLLAVFYVSYRFFCI